MARMIDKGKGEGRAWWGVEVLLTVLLITSKAGGGEA